MDVDEDAILGLNKLWKKKTKKKKIKTRKKWKDTVKRLRVRDHFCESGIALCNIHKSTYNQLPI